MEKDVKMKGDDKLCLNVNDLRAIARVNEIALKLKEMERLLKNRKDENNEMKKEELMNHYRDLNDIHDCGMCPYEFTDICSLRLEKIKKKLKKIINERYGFKKS